MDRAAGALGHRLSPHVMLAAGAASLAALLAALLLAGGRPEAAPSGLPDAGAATAWGLRIVQLLTQVTAIMAIGSLVLGALLDSSPRGTDGRTVDLSFSADRAARAAVPWAVAWACTSAALVVLSASHALGTPLGHLSLSELRPMVRTTQSVGLQASAVVALGVAVAAARARTPTACRVLLGAAVLGLLPATLNGHATTAPDPDIAISALGVHVIAASLWVGGLAAVLLHLRRSSAALVTVLPRFSSLALACYAALGVSGLLTANARLGTSMDSWGTGYGAVVAVKVMLLVVLGVLGHRHRVSTIGAALGGRPFAFTRLAGGEVVLMAAALGLAVALTAIPPPPSAVPVGHAGAGAGTALGFPVPAFSWWALVTAWRLDAVVLVILGTGLVAYLAGVARLSRRGLVWPRSRTIAFVSGLGVVLLDLCSGVATFAPAMVSVQVGQLLVALFVAPLLLASGSPHILWALVRDGADGLEGGTPRGSGRAVSPITGAALVCLVLITVYRTPLIEISLRSHWVSMLVLLTAIGSGLVLWVSVRERTVARGLGTPATWSLAGVASCLAVLAAQLSGGSRLLAGSWFRELGWPWVDPVADQKVAALLMGLAAISLVSSALVRQSPSAPVLSSESPRPQGQMRRTTRPSRSSASTGP